MTDDVIHLYPGDPPPGSFEPGPHGLRVWQGPCEWRTTHGAATVLWLLGRPNRIQGAMTAEGHLDIETSSPLDRDTWRRRSPERFGRWILGTVEIRDDAMAFTDKPSTPLVVSLFQFVHHRRRSVPVAIDHVLDAGYTAA